MINGAAAMTIRPSGNLLTTRVATALPAMPAITFPQGNEPAVATFSESFVRFGIFNPLNLSPRDRTLVRQLSLNFDDSPRSTCQQSHLAPLGTSKSFPTAIA